MKQGPDPIVISFPAYHCLESSLPDPSVPVARKFSQHPLQIALATLLATLSRGRRRRHRFEVAHAKLTNHAQAGTSYGMVRVR